MYTIDNNINTLQDIVQHVWGLSQVEPAIFNNYCACIALRKDTTEVRVLPCFVEEDINQHCYDFLHETVRDAMTTGFSTKTC